MGRASRLRVQTRLRRYGTPEPGRQSPRLSHTNSHSGPWHGAQMGCISPPRVPTRRHGSGMSPGTPARSPTGKLYSNTVTTVSMKMEYSSYESDPGSSTRPEGCVHSQQGIVSSWFHVYPVLTPWISAHPERSELNHFFLTSGRPTDVRDSEESEIPDLLIHPADKLAGSRLLPRRI